MRYSLGTSYWTRNNVRELDRSTRRIMRQNYAHQYGASVERLYLPRAKGVGGLVSWNTPRRQTRCSSDLPANKL